MVTGLSAYLNRRQTDQKFQMGNLVRPGIIYIGLALDHLPSAHNALILIPSTNEDNN